MTPLVIGITGRGNAARGTRAVLDELPLREITPDELLSFEPPEEEARHTLYVVTFGRAQTAAGQFEQFLPYLTMLMNCITWDRLSPRLLTREMTQRLFESETPRLRVIGDVSCDPGGSIEFSRRTYPDSPIYTYEPQRDTDTSLSWEFPEERLQLWEATCTMGHEGRGPIVMAVTNLPCEFPRDASTAFSEMLRPYVWDIAKLGDSECLDAPDVARPVQRATMVYQGELAPDYKYLGEKLKREGAGPRRGAG